MLEFKIQCFVRGRGLCGTRATERLNPVAPKTKLVDLKQADDG